MAPRVSSDLLLVGSLPTGSTEAALRAGAALFGDRVFALPDGETGPRRAWVGYDRMTLTQPHPDVVALSAPASPDGVPRHAYDVALCTLREGVTDLHFDRWPRIEEAIASYRVFRALRDEGAVPPGLRFQVGLPLPVSVAAGGFKADFARDYPVLAPALEDLAARELDRLLAEVPAADLAIQWDVCYEVLDLEGVLAWTSGDAWERWVGPARRLSARLPEDVLLGYHLCYGTFPEWPMYEARDLGLLVRMANTAVEISGRPVDWLHLAGPRYLRSEDDAFFAPLRDLAPGDARVFLGLVLPVDGAPGLARRAATAARHLPDFGVAMYCGFGRQPGLDGDATMREHRDVVASWAG